jgi:AcrR family transcriptional regulator
MSILIHDLRPDHRLRYSVYTVPKSSQSVKEQGSKNPVSSPVTLQERKQQFVRDAIWDAAIDLFDRKGFHGTTVEEIAQAAGTSRRSFFRYFESKSDLLAQAVVSYGTSLTDAIESCPAEYSLGDVFRSTVLRVARHSALQPRTRKVMEIAERYPAAREAQIARVAEVQDRVAEAFARRCRKSQQGELEAQVLAGLTLSMLSATYFSWFRRGTHDIAITAEQVFATLTDIVCRAGTADKQPSASTASVRRKP